jgi:TfoX/Sxy family transcriptional regulator of competence genes
MAYSGALAQRIRKLLASEKGVTERVMFGGLTFMLNVKMFCGTVGNELMVRVGRGRYEEALSKPHARQMDFTGRPLWGMVFVRPARYRTERALGEWIAQGVALARSLPTGVQR